MTLAVPDFAVPQLDNRDAQLKDSDGHHEIIVWGGVGWLLVSTSVQRWPEKGQKRRH